MGRKFVHPGFVTSKTDGDRHYIGFGRLCILFKLDPRKCINASDPTAMLGRMTEDGDEHYYPLYEGNYPLFDKDV